MELELLKESWVSLDKKMQQASHFNQRIVDSIISSRAMTTVDRIKRLNTFFSIVLIAESIFFIAVLIGNPFDFSYNIQYVPYVLLLIGVTVAFLNLLQLNKAIKRLYPGIRIDQYLTQIVSAYERNKRFEKWFGIIFLSVGLLVPVSFIPQKLQRHGLWEALADTAIMISVTLVIYLIAFKLGAFKNPYKNKLEHDLMEWNELKGLVTEMSEIR